MKLYEWSDEELPGTEDWVFVAEADWSEGCYEWHTSKVYYSPSARRYFWFTSSGCSCDGWEDNAKYAGVAGFQNGSKRDAQRAMLREYEESGNPDSWDGGRGYDSWLRAAEKIRQFEEVK